MVPSRTDLLPWETAPLCRRPSEVVPWPRRVLPSRVLAGPWQGAGRLVQEARSVREEVGWATARGKLLSGQDLPAILWPGIGLQPAPFPARSKKWVHPTEAWGAPQPLRAGPLVSRLLAVGSRESCQTVCQQVEGGTSAVLLGRRKEMSRKSKALESQKAPVAFVMDTVPPK